MGERADIFLSTFNRIEKELKRQLGNPVNMSFSEAVRRLSKRRDNLIGDSENDLLQLAQLRNAIVHDQVRMILLLLSRMIGQLHALNKSRKAYCVQKRCCQGLVKKSLDLNEICHW